ncbi:tetratricopeptide repeat protein [Paracoccus sp. SCSIO 75233]|uniref:tetratricopeptide repeat protein n=1 Tax=Paracoccus sp. SCSIO 75233 TaxID=3017782 RepID=UPI0022EFEF6B|nr:tetratricopeptide repeat protein [Paracoccus sp. SCSIO 75233]WBU53178.1 tetratricopeptide repeat protein [Paracoccus sp. SCSIO 75233]
MKTLHSLALAAMIALPQLPAALAQDATPPPPRPMRGQEVATPAAAAEPSAETSPAPLTRGLAGPYLAARNAAMENDFGAAADYYLRAIEEDGQSAYLNDSALVALLASGRIDRAIELADELSGTAQPGTTSRLVGLVERADAARQQDWQRLIAEIDNAAANEDPGSERLLDGLLRAWALLGSGNASEADLAFDRIRQIRGTGPLVDYHMALAKALVGDFEAAAALLGRDSQVENVMGAIVEAQVLTQLDRREDALEVLSAFEGMGIDSTVDDLAARIRNGDQVSFDVITDPRDGIAQVFLTFATLMANDVDPNPLSLIHARLANYIAPDMVDARIMVAQLLQNLGQYDAAEAEFDALRQQGEMRPTVELSRIDALSRADRLPDAEKAALTLTAAQPDFAPGWIALGDLLRQQEKWAQAVPAYDKAISLIDPADEDALWFPHYARGIALERSGAFDRAEADLKRAIEIQPDHPQMLNYLGYSYVDRNENMDEALRLIERAVQLSPNDGYILDSLGWVLYRLGRYEEAVGPQERAVAEMASDPLVNDHLGDIYWMVGREREAEIQWKRALSYGPETEAEAERIRAKIERGLDAVLEDESSGAHVPPGAQQGTGAADGE